jgi:hypothetical protein
MSIVLRLETLGLERRLRFFLGSYREGETWKRKNVPEERMAALE